MMAPMTCPLGKYTTLSTTCGVPWPQWVPSVPAWESVLLMVSCTAVVGMMEPPVWAVLRGMTLWLGFGPPVLQWPPGEDTVELQSWVNCTTAGNMPCLTVFFIDNCIYALGGFDSTNYQSSVERLDPRMGRWLSVPSMTSRRSSCGVAALDGVLYCVGGNDGTMCLGNNLSL